MPKRIAVVISQSQSKNPARRKLEEDIVTGLIMEPGVDVTIVPNLYDLAADGTGMLALKGISGNMIVCGWMFERAGHWVLDRNGIHGHVGPVMLRDDSEDDDDDLDESDESEEDVKTRVIDEREIPNRKIYCLDLRISNKAKVYIEEIKRIQQENNAQIVGLGDLIGNAPTPAATNGNAATNGQNGNASVEQSAKPLAEQADAAPSIVNRVEDPAKRRWYPVIDYSRCTNCMECIDFCLFGVYGVDRIDTILVEEPDNCRKGCPACSRVCPENAIMFPQHKTPGIAGSHEASASLKIDLSQLFGAPTDGKSAIEVAALERDEQLAMAGRDTVGMSVGIPKRQDGESDGPKDDLDDLVDQLNDFDSNSVDLTSILEVSLYIKPL